MEGKESFKVSVSDFENHLIEIEAISSNMDQDLHNDLGFYPVFREPWYEGNGKQKRRKPESLDPKNRITKEIQMMEEFLKNPLNKD